MRLAERLLLSLSHAPAASGGDDTAQARDLTHALDELDAVYPDFTARIRGRRVLDFGSGLGRQAVALAKRGAAEVLGVEINRHALEHAESLAAEAGVADRVHFTPRLEANQRGRYDVVISLNSMEHFSHPAAILSIMCDALHPEGELLISFSPPWYAPYGSHMAYFTSLPWVHLLFSERTVMAVRSRYRSDGAMRYEEVEGGLNRMSLAKFERLIADFGLSPSLLRYDTVKGIPMVDRIPVLRELLVNRVTCALKPAAQARRTQASAADVQPQLQ